MRDIRRGLMAVISVCLLISGGAAFGGRAAAGTSSSTTCNRLDAQLDEAIARGPQTGPVHNSLENLEKVGLKNAGCPPESLPLRLTTSVFPSPTVKSGTQIHDVAHLTGGNNPTGSIAFFVFRGHTCSGANQLLDIVTVNGPGDYASVSSTANIPGPFSFGAIYSGDSNNPRLVSACEPLTITH